MWQFKGMLLKYMYTFIFSSICVMFQLLANNSIVESCRNNPTYTEASYNPYEMEALPTIKEANPYSALGQADNCQGRNGYECNMQGTHQTTDDNLYMNICLK